MIGEPKHGVWRIQDNGMIREYRRQGMPGLREEVQPNDLNLSDRDRNIIANQYSHYMPGDANAYKHPDEEIRNGHRNFVDLSIYHPKYGGKYDDHVPMDLAHFYCTLSQADFPFMKQVWRYASAQKLAGKRVIGPLGKRAGR